FRLSQTNFSYAASRSARSPVSAATSEGSSLASIRVRAGLAESGGRYQTAVRLRRPEPRREAQVSLGGDAMSRHAATAESLPASLDAVWAGVDACRRCDLWRCGNGVAGEGPRHAKLMFVGEQP